jgi:hypothetical protein
MFNFLLGAFVVLASCVGVFLILVWKTWQSKIPDNPDKKQIDE